MRSFLIIVYFYNTQTNSFETSRFLVSKHDERKQLDDSALNDVLHLTEFRIEACKVWNFRRQQKM